MINKQTLAFLKTLAKNNNKTWFDNNREKYQAAKEDFEHFVGEVIAGLGKIDSGLASLSPKDCIFRQYRDIRFSKDKTPYKIHMGAYFNKGGKKVNTPGYYLHIQPGKSMIAGGLYQPEAKDLAKVRQEIDYNPKEWEAILSNKELRRHFSVVPDTSDRLTRLPKGYDASNPMIDHLKLKSFVVTQPLADDEITNKAFLKNLLRAYKALEPMITFLSRSIE